MGHNQNRKASKFRKQEGLCHLCKKPMELQLGISNNTHPESATYEHIKPICKNGKFLENNVVLVHNKCNQKHAKITGKFLLVKGETMDEMIKEQCQILKNDCEDFDDALLYIDEIVDDVMIKYDKSDIIIVREKVLTELKKTFTE